MSRSAVPADRSHPDLTGKRALVTGSSAGIGAATARALSLGGAAVAVASRSQERATAIADEINGNGGDAHALVADLADSEQALSLVEDATDRLGGLDILVNNAGATNVAASEELALEEWRSILDLNLTAPFLCARAAAPLMHRGGGGVILNVTSILGHVGLHRRAAYTASKHGLAGLAKTLAIEWAELGIRVLSIAPAYIETDMVRGSMGTGDYTRADIEARTPAGRLGTVDEVAHVAAFLVSDQASYVTGSSVLVDGGWVANGSWSR